MVGEELPEELQDRLLDEMNHRAVRALSEIPQGEYDALAEAIGNRLSQENGVNPDPEEAGTPSSPDDANPDPEEAGTPSSPDDANPDPEEAGTSSSPDDANPAAGHPFRLLISHVDGEPTALLVCLKCQKVLMDTQPGYNTDTPEGVRCDHTNTTTLLEYLGEDRTEDLEL